MESSMKNSFIVSRHEATKFSGNPTPEESSWTMYFEDFFEATSSSVVENRDCTSSSSVSDAESYVATKKTVHVSNKFDINKRTKNREIPFGRHHHDLEDTASSPSRSPNVYGMMNLLDNNTRHESVVAGDDDTLNEKEESAAQNQNGLSIDLKKKGLCLIPLSMVTNFLG